MEFLGQSIESILRTGLLGALLVLSLIAVYFLYKEAKKERDARLTDMKDVWVEDVKFRGEIKTLLQNILDLVRRP